VKKFQRIHALGVHRRPYHDLAISDARAPARREARAHDGVDDGPRGDVRAGAAPSS
jgi:hypothetical protein